MSKAYDRTLDALLAEADAKGMCLAPRDRHLKRLLRARVSSGSVKEPAKGLFVSAARWESAGMTKRAQAWRIIRGLQHLHPAWVFCSFSAALIHGLEFSNRLLKPVHVISHRSRITNDIVHHAVDSFEIRTVMGLRATDMTRTLFDCLKSCTFPQGLAIADSALRTTRTSREGYLCAIERRYHDQKGGPESTQDDVACKRAQRKRRGIVRARRHDRAGFQDARPASAPRRPAQPLNRVQDRLRMGRRRPPNPGGT